MHKIGLHLACISDEHSEGVRGEAGGMARGSVLRVMAAAIAALVLFAAQPAAADESLRNEFYNSLGKGHAHARRHRRGTYRPACHRHDRSRFLCRVSLRTGAGQSRACGNRRSRGHPGGGASDRPGGSASAVEHAGGVQQAVRFGMRRRVPVGPHALCWRGRCHRAALSLVRRRTRRSGSRRP